LTVSRKARKNRIRKWSLSVLPLYSSIINFIRQISRTATMDHCILRPLYPLFSPCQWSLIAPRTISNVEDEDEEKSGENRQRPRALQLRRGGSAKRESEGTIQELPRDHPKEACLPAMALREFSSPSICRYSPRVRLLLHLERAGAGAAFKHMSAFVCHRDSLRCSLARPFAIRTCGTQIVLRISHANNPLPSSYCALLQLSCVIVLFFFLTFHISSDCSHVLSSSRWYLSLAFCTHISLSLSLSLEGEKFLLMAYLVRNPRSTARGLPPPWVNAENNRFDRLTFR